MPLVTTFIGIGSNLCNPLQQVNSAIAALQQIEQTQFIAHSPWYESTPVGGPTDQPNYINGVAKLKTLLTPEELLNALQAIEKQQGRTREIRWGPRSLDLDLLVYGEEVIESDRLTVPHKEIPNRNFVVIPLLDLEPNLKIPGISSLKKLAKILGKSGINLIS